MAIGVQVQGPTKVYVSQSGVNLVAVGGTKLNGGASPPVADSGALVELGYTRNGVNLNFDHYFLDVPGDEHGGDDGPPIEVQWLGAICRIRCEFTKYDENVYEFMAARVASESYGAIGGYDVGHLMFSNVSTTRVLLISTIGGAQEVINFPMTFIRSAIEINHSSKYSSPIIEFEAHKSINSPFPLHNTTTSG